MVWGLLPISGFSAVGRTGWSCQPCWAVHIHLCVTPTLLPLSVFSCFVLWSKMSLLRCTITTPFLIANERISHTYIYISRTVKNTKDGQATRIRDRTSLGGLKSGVEGAAESEDLAGLPFRGVSEGKIPSVEECGGKQDVRRAAAGKEPNRNFMTWPDLTCCVHGMGWECCCVSF